MEPSLLQWLLVAAFGLLFIVLSPVSRTLESFFSATNRQGKKPGVFMLTSSLVISWIFAKSITVASDLGLAFGFVGGVAYAVYYLSFLVAGVLIYQLRTAGKFESIHAFLQQRFGASAVVVFSLLIGFRLYNEVWSNTMVIGSYFGEQGSKAYYGAILLFTALTLVYTLRGGLRSSLLTDAIQMVFFGVLLFVVLGVIIPKTKGGLSTYLHSGEWSLAMGGNLLLVAFLQIFSYPFHDAVMTDRGFISDPKTTQRSFLLAGVIGFCCILLFSFVGIYARTVGLEAPAAVSVSRVLSVGVMLMINFIMITSAASTLDSAFSASAKLVVMDLGARAKRSVSRGRWVMAAFAVAGTLPVFLNPEILSATTVSGTMVMGLAPVFLLWRKPKGASAFHAAVGIGIVLGLVLALGWWPTAWTWFSGKYGDLLSVNIVGLIACFGVYLAMPDKTAVNGN